MNLINYEDLLKQCEDLEFLNQFAPYLRETEYRVLLLLCGHTRHGKVCFTQLKQVMRDYWHSYNYISHVKNYPYIALVALKKIKQEKILRGFT
jgi:cobalamin biosynthesis Co2+ chelatase CbiK